MALSRGIAGAALGVGLLAGSAYATDKAFEANQQASLYTNCVSYLGKPSIPEICGQEIEIVPKRDTETAKAWVYGTVGVVGLVASGVVLFGAAAEIFDYEVAVSAGQNDTAEAVNE